MQHYYENKKYGICGVKRFEGHKPFVSYLLCVIVYCIHSSFNPTRFYIHYNSKLFIREYDTLDCYGNACKIYISW